MALTIHMMNKIREDNHKYKLEDKFESYQNMQKTSIAS